MKPYLITAFVIALLILVSFLVVEAMGIVLLTDPSDILSRGGMVAASVGGGLLLADIFIPVPSSIIMIAHGAVFGVFWGFMLSLWATVGGAMIGWWLGYKGSSWMERIVSENQKKRTQEYLEHYGLPAVIISRMLPILAETVVIMAGAAGMGWKKVLLACILGTIPPALIYAIAGSFTTDFTSGSIIAVGVFLIAGVSWLVSRHILNPQKKENTSCEQA